MIPSDQYPVLSVSSGPTRPIGIPFSRSSPIIWLSLVQLTLLSQSIRLIAPWVLSISSPDDSPHPIASDMVTSVPLIDSSVSSNRSSSPGSNHYRLYDRFLGSNRSIRLVRQINPFRMILLDQFYPILSLASSWFRSIIHLLTLSSQSHQIGLSGPMADDSSS